jgi:hypothetical protein
MVVGLSKFKRNSFNKNDPANTMDAPPFWKVMGDGYAGRVLLEDPLLKGWLEDISLSVCPRGAQTYVSIHRTHNSRWLSTNSLS